MRYIKIFISVVILLSITQSTRAQTSESAKPWVFWYWMHGAVSPEGITADLEAMKEVGIAGAYLMPIKGVTNPPMYTPAAAQLSPRWWEMVKHSLKEADRLGLKIGMHVSDGFALAGGPWITPELSMQKVVSTQTNIRGGKKSKIILPQPETKENYYRDIAVYAFPSAPGAGISTQTIVPKITTSTGADASFLVKPENKEAIRSNEPLWIQYEFAKPFTARTVFIHTNGNNVQAHRLIIEVSEDGKSFRRVTQLEPPRHGWQDTDADITHSIQPTTAKYFRFKYDKAGSEPGAEDLDAAKWKPSLKLVRLELSAEPRIHQFEGKSGAVWRVSKRSTAQQIPDNLSVPLKQIINLTDKLNADGSLNWNVPKGNWTIIRMGHTSTGHTNATGGAAIGLECDKFNPEAIKLQFDKWYGEALRQAGPELAPRILNSFHVDSWECGSQNWSPVFREEFEKRRGYDLLPYLPIMAGIPVESAEVSEKFLYDVRKTIAELVVDKFYTTLAGLAKEKGVTFTAESVAPTMISDGILHYKTVDIPMGEFWLNSPTHDKPNDMLDAISGAHIYGKNIIQAEAFTTVRMAWNEHPGMMKTLQDRNYALGINKMVYHVFNHNPWVDRKPGMTLDGVGIYFQRDQTWWKQGKAWVGYAERVQNLLQKGKPVADIAVFTGEDIPRRSVLPDRLVPFLPGIFGEEVVEAEAKRLGNIGEPLRQIPVGVSNSANMADAEDFVNPLRGYAYDSFNPDALLSGRVVNGNVVFESGASYKLLVIPGKSRLNPNNDWMSLAIVEKLLNLSKSGAKILMAEKPKYQPGLQQASVTAFNKVVDELWNSISLKGAYHDETFDKFGIERDLDVRESSGKYASNIAYTHRQDGIDDIYFISNQEEKERELDFSFRRESNVIEVFDPVSNRKWKASDFKFSGNRTVLPLKLAANGSLFVIFKKASKGPEAKRTANWIEFETVGPVTGTWDVEFHDISGGKREFKDLSDWSTHADSAIKYYSGTATYQKEIKVKSKKPVWLDLGEVANLAEVKVNGISCGIVWTPPYRVDISKALKKGTNLISVEVTNTWANRLMGDQRLPEDKRVTRTTAPYRLAGQPLQPAGLLGPVMLLEEK
ncbi:glycosyl hydrolase [Paradesertivirga mongoliensis]|uniref:Glycosyl hydrolase n=1 Tax=Paradesertivirga mongoliensis TaxID=2100740 RepID=A0ABW4ZPR9_9SPHI|nr:glycosyl hydrolase [Pedobacter mongoliensis]